MSARRAGTAALAALALLGAGCGGEGGDAKAGGDGKATTATAPAGPLTLEQLRVKTDERCTAFTREVLAYPLPERGRGAHERWNDALLRMERRLVADLRRLEPPRDQAAAYGAALDARERSLRGRSRTLVAVELAAAKLAPFSPHACRYWGIRAFGKEGSQFQSDQGSYCFEDAQKIERAARRVRRKGSPAAAVRTVAKTLERSARLMDVEPPGKGAAQRWDELRSAVDDLGETIETYPRIASGADADEFFDALSEGLGRSGAATWTLGIGNCDFGNPLLALIDALQARQARAGGSSGEAA